MSRRTPSNTEARIPQGAGFYDTDGQRLLNSVTRDETTDALATTFLINHDATDLLEMVGLR